MFAHAHEDVTQNRGREVEVNPTYAITQPEGVGYCQLILPTRTGISIINDKWKGW